MHILFYNYKAWVIKVCNSAMLDVLINLGFRIQMEMRVKLCDFNQVDPIYEDNAVECLKLVVDKRRVIVSPWRPPKKGMPVLCNIYVVCRNPIAELAEAIETINFNNHPERYYFDVSAYMNACVKYKFDPNAVMPYIEQLKLENVA